MGFCKIYPGIRAVTKQFMVLCCQFLRRTACLKFLSQLWCFVACSTRFPNTKRTQFLSMQKGSLLFRCGTFAQVTIHIPMCFGSWNTWGFLSGFRTWKVPCRHKILTLSFAAFCWTILSVIPSLVYFMGRIKESTAFDPQKDLWCAPSHGWPPRMNVPSRRQAPSHRLIAHNCDTPTSVTPFLFLTGTTTGSEWLASVSSLVLFHWDVTKSCRNLDFLH